MQELVKAHGGTIMVDSQLNKGSTFTFTIPRYMGRDSEDSTRSKSLKAVNPGKTLQSFRQTESEFNTIRKSKACSQVDFLKLPSMQEDVSRIKVSQKEPAFFFEII